MARTKYADMVEAEAGPLEDAEHETDEDAEPAGGEPEPDEDADEDADADEQEAHRPALEGEHFIRALEREGNRHAEALGEIFGSDFALFEECPLCHLLGVVSPETVLLDPETERCPKCRGYGGFVTESFVDTNRFRQCERCMGNGYVTKVVPVAVPETFATPSPSAPAVPVAIPPMPQYDPQTNSWRDQFGNVLSPVAS